MMKFTLIVVAIASVLILVIMMAGLFGKKGNNVCIITDKPCYKEVGSCKNCDKYKNSKYYKEVNSDGGRKNKDIHS